MNTQEAPSALAAPATQTAQAPQILEKARRALRERTYFAAYPEAPSPKVYGEAAAEQGQAAYEAHLSQDYTGLAQQGSLVAAHEKSPYTQKRLGIRYPVPGVDQAILQATACARAWRRLPVEERMNVLIDALDRLKGRFFELAHATMHTTGQGYMMAFQASGPHAADRALEALAMAYDELTRLPQERVRWEKPAGKVTAVVDKEWLSVPYGISLAIGCSTFPTWNTLPGMFASLAVGSPVLVKPHPTAVLPLAIAVECVQKALLAAGHPAEVCQLMVDTPDEPLSKTLALRDEVQIIDYTGGPSFGAWLESNVPHKKLFTEKAGVNTVVVESTDQLSDMIGNLAFSISLYSGQMCTAPHHILVPAQGIDTDQGHLTPDEFARKLAGAVDGLAQNPKAGAFVLGAIQNPDTLSRLSELDSTGEEILAGGPITHPQFGEARTSAPKIRAVTHEDMSRLGREFFGPALLVVSMPTADEAVATAARLAREHGAISGAIYSTQERFIEAALEELNEAGVPVSVNLTGPVYMNQNAAFSDMHVTGGNPAGNGSITDASFIVRRFFWVGNKLGRPSVPVEPRA